MLTDETDSYVVTDLESLTDYTFQIAAENAAGWGFSSVVSTNAKRLHRLERAVRSDGADADRAAGADDSQSADAEKGNAPFGSGSTDLSRRHWS